MFKSLLSVTMVLALGLVLSSGQTARADGRTAVTYEVALDWYYPPNPFPNPYRTAYTVTIYYNEDGSEYTRAGYNEAMAEAAGYVANGWTYTVVSSNVAAVTPW